MALKEVRVLLLVQEAGNVARDSDVESIQDSEDQLWPAGGNNINKQNKLN